MAGDESLRTQLLQLLQGAGAHMTFNEAVREFPMDRFNDMPPNVNYSPWHLLEHIRIAQRDILDFVRSQDYVQLSWPDEYWPARGAEASAAAWQRTIDQFQADLGEICAMVADPQVDLGAPLPYERGHSLLREVLLVADHNAYHVGEFAVLRQVMGTWPDAR